MFYYPPVCWLFCGRSSCLCSYWHWFYEIFKIIQFIQRTIDFDDRKLNKSQKSKCVSITGHDVNIQGHLSSFVTFLRRRANFKVKLNLDTLCVELAWRICMNIKCCLVFFTPYINNITTSWSVFIEIQDLPILFGCYTICETAISIFTCRTSVLLS